MFLHTWYATYLLLIGVFDMRDPDRIDQFCNRLKSIWRCVPDWRFGQLMSNMLGAFVDETGRDIFFPEDDEMMEFFIKYIGKFFPEDDEMREFFTKYIGKNSPCARTE